jgi:hypothetical protein
MTNILAIIGGIIVVLVAATQIPAAATAFLRACIPLIAACRELCDAVRERRAREAAPHDGQNKTNYLDRNPEERHESE